MVTLYYYLRSQQRKVLQCRFVDNRPSLLCSHGVRNVSSITIPFVPTTTTTSIKTNSKPGSILFTERRYELDATTTPRCTRSYSISKYQQTKKNDSSSNISSSHSKSVHSVYSSKYGDLGNHYDDHDNDHHHHAHDTTMTNRTTPLRRFDSNTRPPPIWAKFPDGSRFWKKNYTRIQQQQQQSNNNDQQQSTTMNQLQVQQQRCQRPIFVAATRQHVGKTTCSLALISGLKKRFSKVGFLKPVGQQHVDVYSQNQQQKIRVDKDVCLIREHFHLYHIDYEDMSPVIIPDGYTKKYVDGEISLHDQISTVEAAMTAVTDASDIVLCEGTGHCAVGSIVGLNNAKTASLIGADMVLIANGGLGSAFDELELNRVLCQHYNVRVAGVILNKVIPSKLEQTQRYMSKAMFNSWGVPLLGCIPDNRYLGCPALADLETLFRTQLISGTDKRFKHYNTNDINVVTTSLTRFLENLREKPTRTLYICHVTRDDLIVGFLGEYQRRNHNCNNKQQQQQQENTNDPNQSVVLHDDSNKEKPFEGALLICGRKDKYQLSPAILDLIKSLADAPVLVVDLSTHEAMTKIHKFTPKLNIDDTNRVNAAISHYEPYIDFDELIRRTTADNSSFNEPGSISFEELRKR